MSGVTFSEHGHCLPQKVVAGQMLRLWLVPAVEIFKCVGTEVVLEQGRDLIL